MKLSQIKRPIFQIKVDLALFDVFIYLFRCFFVFFSFLISSRKKFIKLKKNLKKIVNMIKNINKNIHS